MNGTYEITLPLPGGDRKATLTLSGETEQLSGTLTDPYNPAELCPGGGQIGGDALTCRTMVGQHGVYLTGEKEPQRLELTLTTHETIPWTWKAASSGTPGQLWGKIWWGYTLPAASRRIIL